MASSLGLLERLEKELECSICLNIYTNPKTLPCLHTFCCSCLNELAKRRKKKGLIACPDCRTPIDLPRGSNFDKFPSAFRLNRLKDIVSVHGQENKVMCESCDNTSTIAAFCFNCECFICAECTQSHSKYKAMRGHRVTVLDKIQDEDVQEILHAPRLCQEEFHDKTVLEYFCKTCQQCICQKCTTITHKNHDLEHLKEATEKAKSRLKETEDNVQQTADVWTVKITKNNERHTKTREQVQQARQAIENNTHRFIELAQRQQRELLTELEAIEEDQNKTYNDQTENMELRLGQLKSIIDYLHSVLQRGTSEDFLQAEQSVLSRAREVFDDLAGLSHLMDVSVEYKPHEDIYRQIEHLPLGRLHVELADPRTDTHIQGLEGKPIGKDCQTQFAGVTKGSVCYSASEQVVMQVPSSTGDKVETKLVEAKEHQDTARVSQAQPPAKSPSLGVHVTKTEKSLGYKAVATFGSDGSRKGQFRWPSGVSVSTTGDVAVSDSVNHQVQLFSAHGQYLRQFGTKGAADGKFNFPLGIAYNKAGHIVVADKNNSRMQVFSPTGRWMSKFGQDVLKHPCGVSVRSDADNIVVCSVTDKKVNVFSSEGVLLLQIDPSPGAQAEPFYAIFCDDKYFVSLDSHTIKVFDMRGSHLYDIGKMGKWKGQFFLPKGLAVDKDNQLLICDSGNNRVQVFTLHGKYVASFGSRGSDEGQFQWPQDVTVTPDGRVFVSDYGNHRICVFQVPY